MISWDDPIPHIIYYSKGNDYIMGHGTPLSAAVRNLTPLLAHYGLSGHYVYIRLEQIIACLQISVLIKLHGFFNLWRSVLQQICMPPNFSPRNELRNVWRTKVFVRPCSWFWVLHNTSSHETCNNWKSWDYWMTKNFQT